MSPDPGLNTLIPLVTPLVSSIIDIFIKPKLQQLKDSRAIDRQLLDDGVCSAFEDYLLRSYDRYRNLSTLALQNQPRPLKDLYEPLVLLRRTELGTERIVVDSFPLGLRASSKSIIVDHVGMGKSTLLRYLFLAAIETRSGIPVFLELRRLKSNQAIVDYIYEQISSAIRPLDTQLFLALLRRGDFIFLMDGFDEIRTSERPDVAARIETFVEHTHGNVFIAATRPDVTLGTFADFERLSLEPLSRDSAIRLLARYDSTGEIVERLRNEPSIELAVEFLKSPLLATLLFRAYQLHPTIPPKRHVYFRLVYDALYQTHDASKPGGYVREKQTGLDIEDFHRALRALAFVTVKSGQVEYTRDQLVSFVVRALPLMREVDVKPSLLIEDLTVSVPLFLKEGELYRWAHKAIQEYFAAAFLCAQIDGQGWSVLREICFRKDSWKYANVIDMCLEMERTRFMVGIVGPLLQEIITYRDRPYSPSAPITPQSRTTRREMLFGRQLAWSQTLRADSGADMAWRRRLGLKHPCRCIRIWGGWWLVENPIVCVVDLLLAHGRSRFVKRVHNEVSSYVPIQNADEAAALASSDLKQDWVVIGDSGGDWSDDVRVFDAVNERLTAGARWRIDYSLLEEELAEIDALATNLSAEQMLDDL